MVGSVLALHRVSPRCFNLSGLRPGSVRDQLLRSTLLVRSLLEEKLILRGKDDRGLLIYGGGLAGINAAMEAAKRGVNATVLEKSDTRPSPSERKGSRRLFSTFSRCMSRRIDATEYDWPHDGWEKGAFLESPLVQIPATRAYIQSAIWLDTWRDFDVKQNGRDGAGKVTLFDNLDASNFRVVYGPDAELSVNGPWPGEEPSQPAFRTFGALVSCVGPGSEIIALKDSQGSPWFGPPFWSDDANIFAGMPLPDGVTHILISGGGDGGMQDLQRAATSYHGGSLYRRVDRLLKPEEKVDDQLRAELLATDESERRAYCWAGTEPEQTAVLERWHRSIEKHVHAFFERKWNEETIETLANGLLREQLLNGQVTITWVVKASTPGPAYVLNRFLVLLLLKLSNKGPRRCIFDDYSRKLWDIVPADGRPANGPAKLRVGKNYNVMIGPASDRAKAKPVSANLILMRHGVDPVPPVLNGAAPVTDQILPFGWP